MSYKVNDKEELIKIIKRCNEKCDFTEVENLNVSRLDDLSYVFYECNNLTKIDLSKWDVSNIKDMDFMFVGCEKLNIIDIFIFTLD